MVISDLYILLNTDIRIVKYNYSEKLNHAQWIKPFGELKNINESTDSEKQGSKQERQGISI